MKWNLDDCSIIGAVCSLHSSAPFSRDAVVLAHREHPGTRMILGREHADGSVEGERMTEAEWRELLACEEALALAAPVAAGRHPKCWLLRESFPAQEQAAQELRTETGVLHHEEAREDVLIVVVDESRAADLLERWSRDAFDHAWRLGQRGEWERAVEYADLAWLTDASLNLDRVALLALALEQARGASEAEDLIAFESNSRLGRPELELRKLIANYRAQFSRSRRLAPLAASMRERQSRFGNLQRWKDGLPQTDAVFMLHRAAPLAPASGAA